MYCFIVNEHLNAGTKSNLCLPPSRSERAQRIVIGHVGVTAASCPLFHLVYSCGHPGTSALPSILLELPVPVVQRADLAGLQPSRDAVEVECMLDID